MSELQSNFSYAAKNEISVIVGRKRTGKTTLMLRLLLEQRRVILIDPSGEYTFGAACSTLGDVCEFISNHPDAFHLRFETRDLDKMDRLAWIACDFGRQSGALTFAIDEAAIFCDSENISGGLSEIVDRGGKWRTSLIVTTHRMTDIHTSIRRQADRIYFFNAHDWYEAALARRYLGQAKTEQLMRLQTGEFFRWDTDANQNNTRVDGSPTVVPSMSDSEPEVSEEP